MNDTKIISLYWNRDEEAIEQTRLKYGGYLSTIAHNILASREDSEECVGDTYLKAWNAIPEDKPSIFSAYLGRITRNISLNRYAKRHTQKRGGGETELLISELQDCVPSGEGAEEQSELFIITDIINMFLDELKPEARALFVRRYWYAQSISELVGLTGYSESKIKSILHRLRCRLKQELEQEGVAL